MQSGTHRQATSGTERRDAGLESLATLLARAYLRLAERSRRDVVSCADAEQISLGESRPESPDHDVEPATRRAS